jgi:hypothetical protein
MSDFRSAKAKVSFFLVMAAIGAMTPGCSDPALDGEASTFDEGTGEVSQALTPAPTRYSIHAWPASERAVLASAILDFITQALLTEHAAAHDWHHPANGELFFSRHHDYLNKLENYLLANGLARFVPVPTWDPATSIPAEFLVVDPLVSGTLNSNPNRPAPSRLRNVCAQPYATASELAVATESWHDGVHGAVGGPMRFTSTAPGAPIFWLWHAFLDHMYHTYQACATPRTDVTAELLPGDGSWGTWRTTAYCPPGQYALGYRMRVEGNQGSGDDTSLNAVQLDCQVPFAAVGQTVSSHDGLWGGWGSTRYCSNARSWAPSNFMSGARIRIESSQGGGDDTAANDVTFLCRDGDTINPGNGRAIGSWSSYAECPSASLVCGVTARIEDPRGSGDDTAMNGIRLKCCSAP